MSLRAEIEETYKSWLADDVEINIANRSRRQYLINVIRPLVTKAKLDKLSDDRLFKLLDLLEED